jgi:diguanylate cyclase (GGDEF)-like protein
VLTLSEELAVKSAENSRLSLVLMLTIVAFICLWGYRIKRSQLLYKKLAQRDGLTGIANRQHFIAESDLAVEYCRKSGREVCVVLLDLDHFKTINDNHGHATGDLILKRVVAACSSQLRSVDLFGRLGGEEFGIVMPDCELADAMQRADALRAAIAALSQPGTEITFPVSASFGVATTSTSGYELHQLIVDADEALYRAKNAGRDRVELFTRAAA